MRPASSDSVRKTAHHLETIRARRGTPVTHAGQHPGHALAPHVTLREPCLHRVAAVGRPAAVGDEVVPQDGSLGRVDQVIRFKMRAAAYLVVAVGRGLGRRYPVVPCSLVTAVDRASPRVHLPGRRESLPRLSETLPLLVCSAPT